MNSTSIKRVNISEARMRLDELIGRAAAGETIVIEREDGAVAQLAQETRPANGAKPYDWDAHLRWLEQQPLDPRSPEEIDSELRSLDRY